MVKKYKIKHVLIPLKEFFQVLEFLKVGMCDAALEMLSNHKDRLAELEYVEGELSTT